MGLFQRKHSDDAAEAEQHFFDEYFREELRNHGRWYFEKIIKENGELFKQDLDATVAQINVELKEHVLQQLDATIADVNAQLKDHITTKLDERFADYGKSVQAAQDQAIQSLTQSIQSLEAQHAKLSEALEKNLTDRDAMIGKSFDESMARVAEIKEAQERAVQSLNHSIQALDEQHRQLSAAMQKNIANQEAVMINVFEENMAQVVEHYLLGALGDQYDLKAQLPSIIQQMETNKQAMVDDLKL